MSPAIEWPTDDETGQVFDLAWLDEGTRRPMTDADEATLHRAATAPHPEAVLWASDVPGYVRNEFHRRNRIARFGMEFALQPQRILDAGAVGGVFYLEWREHIEHLKRTGHLESALALTQAVIDAAERVDRIKGHGLGAAGWYKQAAVILRKMGDYDAEVRLIDDVERRFPDCDYVSDRRAAAERLLARVRVAEQP